jgi:chloramphenicol 3-O-phosphotransferase
MMDKKLILISGSPCVGKTAAGTRLFESFDNSAYLDGDWCWCVHPFSVADSRLRNGDKSMSFVLSNYLDSDFEYVFFTSVVLTDVGIREGILKGITAEGYKIISFTLTCSEETLKKRHDRRGDRGETNYYWLRLPPYPGDIVINTDGKSIREVAREMKKHIT